MKSFENHTVNKVGDNNYFAKEFKDMATIQKVIEKYPVKLSPHIKKLIKTSEAVRLQYLPHPNELESYGSTTPFEEGKKASKTYGLERLYPEEQWLIQIYA